MRVNIKGRDQSHCPAGARESVPQGHLKVAHYEVVGKGVKDSSVPEAEGTIEPSVLGSHTASRAQAANRSSLALAGRVAFEKTRPTTS
jgi:hypothetical protein